MVADSIFAARITEYSILLKCRPFIKNESGEFVKLRKECVGVGSKLQVVILFLSTHKSERCEQKGVFRSDATMKCIFQTDHQPQPQ